jgi:hypothetical protein
MGWLSKLFGGGKKDDNSQANVEAPASEQPSAPAEAPQGEQTQAQDQAQEEPKQENPQY